MWKLTAVKPGSYFQVPRRRMKPNTDMTAARSITRLSGYPCSSRPWRVQCHRLPATRNVTDCPQHTQHKCARNLRYDPEEVTTTTRICVRFFLNSDTVKKSSIEYHRDFTRNVRQLIFIFLFDTRVYVGGKSFLVRPCVSKQQKVQIYIVCVCLISMCVSFS